MGTATVGVIAVVFCSWLISSGRKWTRDHPLVGAIQVVEVSNGVLTLADGRTFRPASVRRITSVPTDQFDLALRTICSQGVVVTRDLGDGSAFLLGEPKFYNWCGTGTWAGGYFQCAVSELMIQARYAEADVAQPSLSARERWRLEGAIHLGEIDDKPTLISKRSAALRFSGQASAFRDYDLYVEAVWKAPPPE